MSTEKLSQPVAWTDAEELRDLEKDGCGAMLSLKKYKGGDPRRQILLFTHPAPETELKAVVERLNASGYEYEDGPVTTDNASAVVEILLKQLDDAVQERGTQSEPAVPEEIPKGLAGQIVSLLTHNIDDKLLARKIWYACRAAMIERQNVDHVVDAAQKAEPVSQSYKLPNDTSPLTQIDMAALEIMPDGEWFSWKDERLKGVNRPHFRCIRLLKAGYLAFRITNPESPYQSIEFMKVNHQEGDDDSHTSAT